MKKIDLNKSLFEITEDYPELIEILVDIGFLGVGNPVTRNDPSHGRIMTIPKGCQMLGINLEDVITTLKEKGYDPE